MKMLSLGISAVQVALMILANCAVIRARFDRKYPNAALRVHDYMAAAVFFLLVIKYLGYIQF